MRVSGDLSELNLHTRVVHMRVVNFALAGTGTRHDAGSMSYISMYSLLMMRCWSFSRTVYIARPRIPLGIDGSVTWVT